MDLGRNNPLGRRHVLPPAIKEFREHRPDLRIRLFDAGLGTIARRMEAGKLDFGLGIFKRMPVWTRAILSLLADGDSPGQECCL